MKELLQPALLRSNLRRRLRLNDTRGHSRFVNLTKWTLPSIALFLLFLIAIWPQLEAVFERVRFHVPRIDLAEARNLRIVEPRYAGIDRENRPYVLTANAASQTRPADDHIALDSPKADLTTKAGDWVEFSGRDGTYQTQPQLLDVYGDVALYQDRGNEFHTESAHIDLANGTAEGHQAVTGRGPFGQVTAEGFAMYNRGQVLIFTGKTDLILTPRTDSK